ncbi:MAG: diguanylate cyclase [Nevskia sp.]|nr:diguanylate cyclase [Nevskia sp.]
MEQPDLPPGFANEVLNSLTAHIAVLDVGGRIVSVNEAWRRFARENNGECETFYVGANYLAVCREAIRRGGDGALVEMLDSIRAVLRGDRDHFEIEYPCNSPTEERWFIVRVTRCRREATASIIVSHEDITARKRAEEDLRRAKEALEAANRDLEQALAREQQAARTDYLTSICNRRHFFDLAEHAFEVSRRYRHPLSVILFDVDHFKQVNDRWGHQIGDEILKSVARIAGEHLRDSDVLARYGGEEFAVLLPESDARQALIVADRIRESIAAHHIADDEGTVKVTISAGIANALGGDDALDRLIHRADQALYAAKKAGRNRVTTFSLSNHSST